MKKIAPIFILTAGILWGCLGIFVRKLNAHGLFSMDIVSLRAIVTCLCMALFLVFYDRKLFQIRFRDIWCFLGTGICSIVFFNFCYFKAIAMTSLSVAAVLLYTAPAIVMVLSFFLFQESFTKRKIIALFLTFTGCVLVTGVMTNQGNVSLIGILYGMGAGLGYALYSIFGRYAIKKGYHTLTITFYTFLIAGIGTLFFADLGKIFAVMTESRQMCFFGMALGIVGTVLPYMTYTIGLQYVDNSKASIIASIEPVTATLVGLLLYQEAITPSGLLGMILVFLGLFICSK
jgi:drug/metabolite transporter (DMT)-like permease